MNPSHAIRTDLARHLARLTATNGMLSLGSLLQRELVGKASVSLDQDRERVIVLGTLNLSYDQVSTRASSECGFYVGRSWRTHPPGVFCRAPWRRQVLPQGGNADWHLNGDGSLCYELPERWRDTVSEAETAGGENIALLLAAAWCLGSVRWLLYHHLEAYRANLLTWPPEWPAWGHYQRGPAEYAKILAREAARPRTHKHPIPKPDR